MAFMVATYTHVHSVWQLALKFVSFTAYILFGLYRINRNLHQTKIALYFISFPAKQTDYKLVVSRIEKIKWFLKLKCKTPSTLFFSLFFRCETRFSNLKRLWFNWCSNTLILKPVYMSSPAAVPHPYWKAEKPLGSRLAVECRKTKTKAENRRSITMSHSEQEANSCKGSNTRENACRLWRVLVVYNGLFLSVTIVLNSSRGLQC